MAIKFRRIEDRAESVIQRREREAVKRQRVRLLPKAVILLTLAGGAVVLYAYFRPPRIVAPFLVHVDAAQVAAPVEGTLTWLLPAGTTHVGAGDEVARIGTRPQSPGSAAARTIDLRLRAAAAAVQAAAEQADRGALEADFSDRERRLRVEVSRLEAETERAKSAEKDAERMLAVHAQDAESVERLRRLGAATMRDATAAQEAVQAARADRDKAASYARSLESELSAARASLEEFGTTKRLSLAAADTRAQGAQSTCEALAEAAHAEGDAFSADGAQYVLRAPIAGELLSVDATQESYVERGAPLLQIYDDAQKVARAYVPVRYRRGLRQGAPARLYVQGLEDPIPAQVAHIHERIVPLPPSLCERLGYKEASVLTVDIRCAPDDAERLIPGQIGRAVIEK